MRRFLVLLCAMILVLSVASPAVAQDDQSLARAHDERLTLWATEADSIALAPDGTELDEADEDFDPEAGTRFLSVDTLYADAERTDEVGENRISCVLVRSGGETEDDFFVDVLCHGVLTLDGQGDVTWQTSFTFTPDFDPADPFATVALTGGTGAFVGASGEVDLFDDAPEDDPDAGLTRYEITLLLP